MLTIGHFSKICKVTPKTLRYYDEIGLLKPSYTNPENNYRYYDSAQLETILFINKLKGYGCSLEEVALILQSPQDHAALLALIIKKKQVLEATISQQSETLKSLAQDIFNLNQGIHMMNYLHSMNITLHQTDPMNLCSIREKINIADFSKNMARLFQLIGDLHLTPVSPPMTIYHDEAFNPECYDMEIAVPVQEITELTRVFPGYLCAMTLFKGPYSEVSSAYTAIRTWIEQHQYELNAAPFEIYRTDPQTTQPEDTLTEVYFPVLPKASVI